MSARILTSILLTLTTSLSLQARKVRTDEIRPFARNFSCSNPKLQWQFNHLESLYDENFKMRDQSGSKLEIIESASQVGGNGDWLYRGVTNRQFNEQQILAFIFNDPTTISESRWFSGKMFSAANITMSGDYVSTRASYYKLPFDKRWKAFEEAYNYVDREINQLLNSSRPYGNAFEEHVRIGSSFNSTPQAIQFLTPHIGYAEGYGEFVLHIKEVVKRGVDVERYNYHHPQWSYSIGSIYSMDRDEYMVPSHIPAWDVQIVKVRNGTGWHKGNYGAPIYYYTKVFEDKNPCNVIGVRVDRAAADGNDQNRTPVGMILRCDNGKSCKSQWDGSLREQARLKAVVESTVVQDSKLYYIPYSLYQSGDPDIVKTFNLATVVSYYDHFKSNVKNDVPLWRELLLNKYSQDYKSAFELTKLNPVTSSLKPQLRESLRKRIQEGNIKLRAHEVEGFLDFSIEMGLLNLRTMQNLFKEMVKKESHRMVLYRGIQDRLEDYPELGEVEDFIINEMKTYEDLPPSQEFIIHQSEANGKVTDAMVQVVAKGFSKEAGFAVGLWDLIEGDDTYKLDLIEKALVYNGDNESSLPLTNPLETIWSPLYPQLAHLKEKKNILGLCIDYMISFSNLPAWKLTEVVGQYDLPEDREIDTIRSLFGYAKNEQNIPELKDSEERTNLFHFLARTLRAEIFFPLDRKYEALDSADGGDRVAKLKTNFNQFYWEFISPPAPFLAFSALNNMRKISEDDSFFFSWPKTDPVVIKLDGVDYSASQAQIKAILAESSSVYYLEQLFYKYRKLSETEKEGSRVLRKHLSFIKDILDAYKNYFLNGLEDDLSDDLVKRLAKERFEWNPNEDLAGLVNFVGELRGDRQEKSKLKALAKKIVTLFPEMNEKMPQSLLDADGVIYPFWQQLKD